MFFLAIADKELRVKSERLYYKYRKLMFKVAYEILGDGQLAEDAVGESFLRIIKNLHKIDEENCPQTRNFLVIICRNVAIDMKKKRQKYNESEMHDNDYSEKADPVKPDDVLVSRENMERLVTLIKELDPKYRDVFLLKRVHGFSREAISKMLGISEETVKKRLYRAKQMLMEALRKEGIGNER